MAGAVDELVTHELASEPDSTWAELHRGGFGPVKQLLERNSQEHVMATCRNPDGASGLIELKKSFPDRASIFKGWIYN
ncbi:hypothetical protein Tco_1388266 [Tanacetum coccineum]